ncbi:Uncharacterised protein [Mycobacterium tuberculosis]|nr:Uncharacterised protein [Mycobacterium tuberculosis]
MYLLILMHLYSLRSKRWLRLTQMQMYLPTLKLTN